VVLRVPHAPGSEFGQELSIPTNAILRVETHQPDGARSVLLAAGFPRGQGRTRIRVNHSPGDSDEP
jgi:hypothetical protein